MSSRVSFCINNYVQNLVNPNTKAISKMFMDLHQSKKHDQTGVGPLSYGGKMYTDSLI